MSVGRNMFLYLACVLTTVDSKSVAVIGGGIGGATAALELLSHPDKPDVILFEAHSSIGTPKSASGIIAASLIFNTMSQYWHEVDDPEDVISKLKQIILHPTARQVQFGARGQRYRLAKDPRREKETKKKFFEASRKRMEYMLDLYPELCGAIIGPYCCREESKARAWMGHNECGHKSTGWAHTFFTEDDWKHANKEDEAKKGGWEISGKGSQRYNETSKFLIENDLAGVLWNDVDEGFVRVEDLFPIMAKIFEGSKKVQVMPNCKVDYISMPAPPGRLQVNFPNGTKHCGDDSEHIFDSIIVSAGANSVNVLAPQDEVITEQILPVKGYACATNSPLIEESLRNLGVQYEEKSHYIRAQKNGGVRYGFGKTFGGLDDQIEAIDPQFREDWVGRDAGINATALGRKVMSQPDVQKLAGIRPLSALGNFPIIKTYPGWPGLILTSGYGWHGFTLSWKSAQLAAELALNGSIGDPDWRMAYEEYAGCTMWSPMCWAWYSWVALGVVFLLLLFCCYKLCCASKSDSPPAE